MNSCARVAFEVIKDKKVQDAFVELINQEYIFDSPNDWELTKQRLRLCSNVYHQEFVFISPGIVVTYDHSLHQVVNLEHIFF